MPGAVFQQRMTIRSTMWNVLWKVAFTLLIHPISILVRISTFPLLFLFNRVAHSFNAKLAASADDHRNYKKKNSDLNYDTERWEFDGDEFDVLVWRCRKLPIEAVLLIISGNPGVSHYYVPFASAIARRFPDVEILVVGHLGHDRTATSRHSRLYSLQDQVKHKIAVLDQVASLYSNCKIMICGHSIGAWICLKLLQNVQNVRPQLIHHAFLLFPVIEHIGKTPNARHMRILIKPGIRHLSAVFVHGLRLVLRERYFRKLVNLFGEQADMHLDTSCDRLLWYSSVNNALYMTAFEFAEVVEADIDTIRQHLPRLTFYYGASDKWSPVANYHKMKARFPDGDIVLCQDNLPHAFVLRHHDEMAEKLGRWIKTKLQQEVG